MNYLNILAWLKCVPIREWARILALNTILLVGSLPLPAAAANTLTDSLLTHLYDQYSTVESATLYRQGGAFLEQEQLDEAFICFSIVGNRYTPAMSQDERLLCARAMNNAGGIAQLRFSYSTAFSYYIQALQITDVPIYQSYNNIAGIYLFYKDYDNARLYLSKAFSMSMEQHDWATLMNALDNIVFLNWCTNSISASASVIDQFNRLTQIPHDARWLRSHNLAKGMTAQMAGNDSLAISCYERNAQAEAAKPDFMAVHNEHLYMARLYMQHADYTKALAALRTAESLTNRDEGRDMLLVVYAMMADCFAMAGDSAAGHQARYSYMCLKDSINTAEEYGKIKNMEFFHQVEQYETQMHQLSQEKNTRTLIAVVSIVALVAVVSLLVVTIRQKQRLRDSYKDLYRINVELARQTDKTTTHQSTTMTDETSILLMKKIEEKMADVSFISQPDLTVERLALSIGTHERYVSAVINEQKNMNFNTLLNEYRIREICKRLTDFEHYGMQTNEAIAEEMGYKSRSHFTRTFKKVTGLTPTQYQQMAKMDND